VGVEVSWTSRGGEQSVRVATLLYTGGTGL
jgi:hypothetical protein